ncbi:MAG: hypothetical protein FDX21_04695 [Chlorobium sp.]|nr:MAG: hypothetical protein FDX21_04695 [Chlorobium sp.]
MEKTVAYLYHHPVLFFCAIIISFMILFSFLKKVAQVVLVMGALFVLYSAYLYVSGGHIPETFQHLEHTLKSSFHFLSDMFNWFLDLLKFPKIPKKELF